MEPLLLKGEMYAVGCCHISLIVDLKYLLGGVFQNRSYKDQNNRLKMDQVRLWNIQQKVFLFFFCYAWLSNNPPQPDTLLALSMLLSTWPSASSSPLVHMLSSAVYVVPWPAALLLKSWYLRIAIFIRKLSNCALAATWFTRGLCWDCATEAYQYVWETRRWRL